MIIHMMYVTTSSLPSTTGMHTPLLRLEEKQPARGAGQPSDLPAEGRAFEQATTQVAVEVTVRVGLGTVSPLWEIGGFLICQFANS